MTNPTPYQLHPEDRVAIEKELKHYEQPRAASIGALKRVQQRHGWVPDAAIGALAQLLGISAAELEGVATGYNLIYRRPVGRYVIKVCDSVACLLTGYEPLRDALCTQLGIGLGQSTPDGRFTLLPICCLGACDRGPTLMINDDTHFNVSPPQLAGLLERYP